jgi:hypothetical protein
MIKKIDDQNFKVPAFGLEGGMDFMPTVTGPVEDGIMLGDEDGCWVISFDDFAAMAYEAAKAREMI